jgi:ActR/RegA family two-component response regulator
MSGHVLVVDDDALFRRAGQRSLMRAGFAVATADSVQGALLLSTQGPFDAAIIDYFLGWGGETGCDLIAPLRARRPTIRVAIISGLGAMPDLIRRAHRAGADTVVSKTGIDWRALVVGDPPNVDPPPLRPVVDLDAQRCETIHGALLVHHGNVSMAARALGMSRSGLQRLLRKMPLPVLDDEEPTAPHR